MVKFAGRKINGGIFPIDDDGTEELEKVNSNKVVHVEVIQKRNMEHLAKFWVFAQKVYENQQNGFFKDKEDVKEFLAKATGHSREYYDPIMKRIEVRAVSIAAANMTQDRFDVFYKDIVDIVNKRIAPGLGTAIQEELERF